MRNNCNIKIDSEVLVCPHCTQSLVQENEALVCKPCNRNYPIVADTHLFISDNAVGSTQKNMLEYYGNIAKSYNICHGSSLYGTSYNIKKYYQRIFDKYIPKQSIILEFGAGTGRFSHIFRNYAKKLYISDLSFEMLAQNTTNSNLRACADTQYLPFESDSCDCAIGMTTFSYVPNKDIALKGLTRIVKKNGIIIIVDQNAKSWIKTLAKYYYFFKRKKNRVNSVQESHLSYMKELFIKHNIDILETKTISFVPHALPKFLTLCLTPFDSLLSTLPLTKHQGMRYYIIGRVRK